MPQGDEARVGGEVLEGQRVVAPEDPGGSGGEEGKDDPRRSWPSRSRCAQLAPPMFDPNGLMGWVALLGGNAREGLRWAAHHTGLPVVLVAAMTLVTSWHLLRRGLRFAVEVAVAAVLLLAATKLGLLSW